MKVTAQEKMEVITNKLSNIVHEIIFARMHYRNSKDESDKKFAIEYWSYFCVMYERCMMELDRLIPEDPLYWACQQKEKVTPIIDICVRCVHESTQDSNLAQYPHLLNHKATASQITNSQFWDSYLPSLEDISLKNALIAVTATMAQEYQNNI